jgi:membrane protein YdbS with pleckstrin-like domain
MASPTQDTDQEVWKGRPWILPHVVIRTILVAVIIGATLFLENLLALLNVSIYGLLVLYWTIIVFSLIWILTIFNLLVLRYTNRYILRVDSLEIKTGLLTTKNSVIVPTGFSDLEVIRSISNRVFGTGDIVIKTQSERDFTKRLVKVKNPMRVANMIRDVMARQIFKLDERSPGKNA